MAGRIYRRGQGDVLQPERFTGGVVRGLKTKAREWSGQYQQEPNPESGVIFNPNWWKYYRSRDPLPEFDLVAISVDCAFKSAAENDLVSIQKWGATGPRCYFLECSTQHLGFAATKAAIKAMQNDGRRASVILVEDKANGSAIIEELRSDADFGADVISITPDGGKEARAHAASATAEAGNVYLPEDAPWLATFLRTAAAFPAVRHDDDIDALTQFINWRRSRGQGELGLVKWFQQCAADIAAGLRNKLGEWIAPSPKPTSQLPARPGPVIATSRPAVETFVCPACQSRATVRIGSVPGTIHCNQCSTDFDAQGNVRATRSAIVIGVNCCPHAFRQEISNFVRCGACGAQSNEPQAVGMSRRQYESQRGYRRFG